MSDSKKMRGVSPNYLQFLWSNIAKVREAQNQGEFAVALKEMATLIPYLPDEIKDKFTAQANQINASMKKIASGNIKKIQALPDPFLRRRARNMMLESYATQSLQKFVGDLCSELNSRGYMESTREVPRGYGQSWTDK